MAVRWVGPLLARGARTIADHTPRHGRAGLARRLASQANTARDQQHYQLAAALYEEALRLTPGWVGVMVQCGHMMKESGNLVRAEQHYLKALSLSPANPEIALQLGHFYKIADRPGDSHFYYTRALTLNPGWRLAEIELERFGSGEEESCPAADNEAILPELLPVKLNASDRPADGVTTIRLGARRVHNRWGMKVLRGVQAIRGVCLTSQRVTTMQILLESQLLHTISLDEAAGHEGGQRRYVFNIWHDFSDVTRGRHRLALHFLDANGRRIQSRREEIFVDDPLHEADYPASDAVVDPADADLDATINTRPSMIRSAHRSILGGPARAILVQRVDQLGDLVISVPALQRLRRLAPNARIVGLLSAANAEFGKTLDLFDDIVVADIRYDPVQARRVMTAEAQRRLRDELAPFAFDVAIDLIDDSASRALLKLSGARFLFGVSEREAPWLSGSIESRSRDPANELENTPISGRLVAIVERVGAMLANPAQVVPRPELRRDLLDPFGLGGDERYVMLHAGSRLGFNRWPHYDALVALLIEQTDYVVAMIADDEQDLTLPSDLRASPRIRLIVGRLDFDRFDALVSFCVAFVGNDSGPKQLATLRGAKVLSVHMPRLNWSEWGQEGDGLIISRRVPCAGCAITAADQCGRALDCMKYVQPDEVFRGLAELLAQ